MILKLLIPAAFLIVMFSGCQDPLSTERFDDAQIDVISREVPIQSEIKVIPTTSGQVSYQCDTYIRPNGEIYLICTPVGWPGGDLVIYAHGYVSAFEPIQLPIDEIETALPLAANFGMAFATTSFSKTGLAIQTGIEEIRDLNQFFMDEYMLPDHTLLAGGSQGGIITTLTLERYPNEFDGGFSLCGPCGYFQKQLNHYGDFRLLFDYFFPDVLPRDSDNPFTKIPPELIQFWEIGPSGTAADSYMTRVLNAISINVPNTEKFMKVSRAPFDPGDINTVGETVLATLWYHIFTIENSVEVFEGLAFDNTKKYYFGTGSWWEDLILNKKIPRIQGDDKALQTVKTYYETSGEIEDPLVMMHTTLDPIQLFWQQQLYSLKILRNRNWVLFKPFKIEAYGHCNFTPEELLVGFNKLLSKVAQQELIAANN